MTELYPLRDWSAKDVWAYILSQGLPYLSTYDLYGPVVGWEKVRMVTFFDPEFDHLGNRNLDGVLMWKFKNL
jgi:3'-phosphoadenosine 5'-phosphosulfate sulfotransferase (PAPS reductase)/FAD synthetase